MAVTTAVTVLTGEWDPTSAPGEHTLYAVVAGPGPAGAVVGNVRAFSPGPVSSVVPIHGPFTAEVTPSVSSSRTNR